MDDVVVFAVSLFDRAVDGIGARLTGPMSARMIVQPALAVFFALRSGIADARLGHSPYFWAIFTDARHRRALLEGGWKDVGKVYVLASILDGIYQYLVSGSVAPVDALLVAALLAIAPYLLMRGAVTRLMTWERFHVHGRTS